MFAGCWERLHPLTLFLQTSRSRSPGKCVSVRESKCGRDCDDSSRSSRGTSHTHTQRGIQKQEREKRTIGFAERRTSDLHLRTLRPVRTRESLESRVRETGESFASVGGERQSLQSLLLSSSCAARESLRLCVTRSACVCVLCFSTHSSGRDSTDAKERIKSRTRATLLSFLSLSLHPLLLLMDCMSSPSSPLPPFLTSGSRWMGDAMTPAIIHFLSSK